MKILLLLPILLYVALLVFNLDSLLISNEINFFNFYKESFPVLIFSSIFFIGYIIFLFVIYDLKGALVNRKIDNLESEIISLKSMLFDKREDILKNFVSEYNKKLDNITKEQKQLFEDFKKENEIDLAKQKGETNRILDKLNLIDKSIFDKFKENFKK